ncbi:hypothetical protein [Algiphilus sp.]|uniref:hypothetical protein n=1 Tax=Algiphilus sp. TaxID=1872431 RepID=UPI0025BD4738|nr:hypothetical protein [Algiphilus sp.]MCK5772016.1 hypothetical protein [Algiphilus sp.]
MSRAWVFDEPTLERALATYAQRLVAEGALPADEAEPFAQCVAGFLRSDEAAALRVAELEREAPRTTGNPNSVIR